MKGAKIKIILAAAALGLAAYALVQVYRTPPVLVDTAEVVRGPLVVTLDDDGVTRVRERYTICAPMDGQLLRTNLDAGAVVEAQATVIAEFEPLPPHLLDARALAEAQARVERAEASLNETKARATQAQADFDYAESGFQRRRELAQSGVETPDLYERAQRDRVRAKEGLQAARFAVQVAEHELRISKAALLQDVAPDGGSADQGGPGSGLRRIPLRSPIDGKVIRVFEESARPIIGGTAIAEVGNTNALEVIADYLSQDAVNIEPGMAVRVVGWGGDDQQLQGVVRLVEPGGFTKVSALGVEEQRVLVVVDPVIDAATDGTPDGNPGESSGGAWSKLGDGFRVELQVVVWEKSDVVSVPTGALFRESGRWAVFVIDDEDVAQRRFVDLGRRNGLHAEVLGGLQEGARVVLYPSELIGSGTQVEWRT